MRTWPDKFVHTVVTSPPYWGLRDYGVKGQLGLEKTPEEYVAKMVAVFKEVKRVLKDDGTLWLNIGDSYWGGKGQSSQAWSTAHTDRGVIQGPQHQIAGKGQTRPQDGKHESIKPKDLVGIPWRVAFALQADGWYLRSDIIWHKPNPMPESVTDRPTKSHEYIFLLTKSERYFYDAEAIREPFADIRMGASGAKIGTPEKYAADAGRSGDKGLSVFSGADRVGRNKRTVWTISTKPFSEAHFATFPEELVEPCVMAGTSDAGVCEVCGTPWERLIEFKRSNESNGAKNTHPSGWDRGEGSHNKKVGRYPNGKGVVNGQAREKHDVRDGPCVRTTTKGWNPTCECKYEGMNRAVVLDPFMGAGTTALVAARLNRNFIGCELNPEYKRIADKRVASELAQGKFL